MPKLDIEGYGEYDVEEDARLVLALTDVAGVDQLHACGGRGDVQPAELRFLRASLRR